MTPSLSTFTEYFPEQAHARKERKIDTALKASFLKFIFDSFPTYRRFYAVFDYQKAYNRGRRKEELNETTRRKRIAHCNKNTSICTVWLNKPQNLSKQHVAWIVFKKACVSESISRIYRTHATHAQPHKRTIVQNQGTLPSAGVW